MSERTFLEKFPGLLQEQVLDEDGVCRFIPYYNHLNEMIEKWDGRAKYDVTHSPSPCKKRNKDSQFILFGIKEGFENFLNNKIINLKISCNDQMLRAIC